MLFFGFMLGVYPRRALPGAPADFRYAVPIDATATRVAADLGRLGVVDSPFVFATYLRLVGAPRAFREGEVVVVRRGGTPRALASQLARGLDTHVVRVVIPEGFDMRAVAERLESKGFGTREGLLAIMRSRELLSRLDVPAESAEGYLFPDTYEFRADTRPEDVVVRMVENFHERTDEVFERHDDAATALELELGLDRHEVLVLASMVEKEAAVADERARIAGVFLNRLRSSTFLPLHRLQSDPTVAYGCRLEPERAASCANFRGVITRAMLGDEANRYNTYRHSELPPGPICSPGKAAIESVLTAERHGYFYFVARGDRRHAFSATLEGHNEAVDDARDRGVLP